MTILPNFDLATFLPNDPIDNPYSPLIPGTILSYEATEIEEDEAPALDELEDVIDNLEDVLEDLADDIDDIEEALDSDSDDSDDDDDDDDNDNDDDEDDGDIEIEDLIQDIEDLLDVIEEIEEDVDDIEEALDLNDDDDDDNDDDSDEEDHHDTSDSELQELEEVIDELEDALEDLADDIDDIEEALDPDSDDSDDSDEELESDDDGDDTEGDIEDLIDDIEDLLEVVEEIEEDVEDIEDALKLENNDDEDDYSDSGIRDGNEGSDYAAESNQVYVTFDTKNILGVQTVVVRDIAWEEGVLVEDTFDWYAQDTDGNVWYMGEIATNYEYDDAGNFLSTNTDGSWEAGVDGALPGYIMEANPQVGDRYFQEFAQGIAEDEGEVVALDETVTIDLGTFENVLKTRDFTALEPDVFEFKYYAPNVGQILADEGITEVGGEPELSPELVGTSTLAEATLPALGTTTFEYSATIDNEYFPLTPGNVFVYQEEELDTETGEIEQSRNQLFVTEETKDILGVTTRVVRDRTYEDGLLVEEEFAYYAQDTDGNVWIMGEDSTEYEYGDNGQLLLVDTSDAWMAGLEQNLPGFVALGTPEIGDTYYQQFQIGEVEEQARVVDVNETVSIDLATFTNALVIEESSALEPEESDRSYYVPGLGEVMEQEFDDGVQVASSELVGIYRMIEGTDGCDRLVGTKGDDLIDGGLGRDRYIGRKGADTFVIGLDQGIDKILDFKSVQNDRIALGAGLTYEDLTVQRHGSRRAQVFVNDQQIATITSNNLDAINESAFITL